MNNEENTQVAPRIAGPGRVWVCGACGKTHGDRYGVEGDGSRGWDESCMMNAVLCHSEQRPDAADNNRMKWWAASGPLPAVSVRV